MQTTTRTLRLTAATAAALVLMTGAAQAHPLAINGGQAQPAQNGAVHSGTSRPTSPANNVALAKRTVTLAPDRADRIGPRPPWSWQPHGGRSAGRRTRAARPVGSRSRR